MHIISIIGPRMTHVCLNREMRVIYMQASKRDVPLFPAKCGTENKGPQLPLRAICEDEHETSADGRGENWKGRGSSFISSNY